MKIAKKIIGLAIACVMVCSFAALAFAENPTSGSITVNNATAGQTYKIYRVLELVSYDDDNKAYVYKADSDWETFLNQDTIKGVYVDITDDDNKYVTWHDSADAAAFAQLAKAYANDDTHPIAADQSILATSDTVVFNGTGDAGLPLGYYLMDSTMGALCSLDTSHPNATLREKNTAPTLTKEVNGGGESYGETNTAKIGDTLIFRVVITANDGAENYVLHDKMTAGLTFNEVPEKVTVNGTEQDAVYWRKATGDTTTHKMTAGTDYNVVTSGLTDDCAFEVKFTQTFLDSIDEEVLIDVHYTATLNENAFVGGTAGTGETLNTNEAKLSYGDSSSTTWDSTTTYTYKFDVIKDDSNKKLLTGATFKLYSDSDLADAHEVALVATKTGEYRVATSTEKAAQGFTAATITAGQACIQGLSNGTYYLKEITAPGGYNKLLSAVKVTINNADNCGTVTEGVYQNDGGVEVTNTKGNILPSTGGVGAVIFFVIGGLLIASGVALVVNKRRKQS